MKPLSLYIKPLALLLTVMAIVMVVMLFSRSKIVSDDSRPETSETTTSIHSPLLCI